MQKIVLLFVGVLVSSLTFARTGDVDTKRISAFAVVKKAGSSYKLIYRSPEILDVTITILNEKNVQVFKETVKKSSGFIRPYNLENLPAGSYTFEINRENFKGTELVKEESADSESETLKLSALIKIQDGQYLLTAPSKEKEKLSIKISTENGDMLYNESVMTKGAFVQLYSIKNPSGTFSFEIEDGHGHTKTFVK
jgi:hypothetical protein